MICAIQRSKLLEMLPSVCSISASLAFLSLIKEEKCKFFYDHLENYL